MGTSVKIYIHVLANSYMHYTIMFCICSRLWKIRETNWYQDNREARKDTVKFLQEISLFLFLCPISFLKVFVDVREYFVRLPVRYTSKLQDTLDNSFFTTLLCSVVKVSDYSMIMKRLFHLHLFIINSFQEILPDSKVKKIFWTLITSANIW